MVGVGSSARRRRSTKRPVIYQRACRDQEEGKLPTDRSKWTVDRAADEWMQRRLVEGRAENTIRTDRERLQMIRRYFGTRRIVDITLDEIYEYRRNRVRDAGSRTINLEVKVLRMILSDAKCWSRLAGDYKPLKENRRGPGVALNGAELAHLIRTASSQPEWEAAFLAAWIAANTTMRGGEIRQLRHRNVDLLAGVVRIERQTTKTDGGCREIPLNQEAKDAILRLLDRARRLGSSEPDHFLFPSSRFRHTKGQVSSRGTGYDPTKPAKTWRTAWRTLRLKAGFPKLRFHDLRHTAITSMAIGGVPIPTIMAVAGHLSPEMTRHYTHVSTQAKEAAVERLGVFRSDEAPTKQDKAERNLRLVKGSRGPLVSPRVHSSVHCDVVRVTADVNG